MLRVIMAIAMFWVGVVALLIGLLYAYGEQEAEAHYQDYNTGVKER